jgi:hypothetical protein
MKGAPSVDDSGPFLTATLPPPGSNRPEPPPMLRTKTILLLALGATLAVGVGFAALRLVAADPVGAETGIVAPPRAPEPVAEPVAAEVAPPVRPPPPPTPDGYAGVPAAPRSALDQQPWAHVEQQGDVRLVNVAPAVGRRYLLTIGDVTYDLSHPGAGAVTLGADGLVLDDADGERVCAPWVGDPSPLARAAAARAPWVSLCDGRLWLSTTVEGRKTRIEWTTDFLRDHVAGGETFTEAVKAAAFTDAYLQVGEERVAEARATPASGPPAAALRPDVGVPALAPGPLGVELSGHPTSLAAGQWYPVDRVPDVYLSAITPRLAAEVPDLRGPDSIEATALAFLVAFDLSAFDVAYVLGTDHPRVDWSSQTPSASRYPLPGPDGFDTVAPFARPGLVPAFDSPALVATFTAGFKRSHSAPRRGELARVPGGSHNGFVGDGVVYSRPVPGLATVAVDLDGRVDVFTWTDADTARLSSFRNVRQNGFPLVQRSDAGPVVGALVEDWPQGNWSGTAEGSLRTLRAGACVVEEGDRRYLVYGYFTAATPRVMARVFLAYGCETALQLDMNALEHTYLAIYPPGRASWEVMNLDVGMAVLDKRARDGSTLPRFVAFADNRDFFYVRRKGP